MAKAQLKKEMLAQDVRKSIADAVLPVVLGEVSPSHPPSPSPTQQAEPEPAEEGPKVIEVLYVRTSLAIGP